MRTKDAPKPRRVRRVSNSADVLPSRYQAIVLASDAPTAVRHVGGWLCDHAVRGWYTSAVLIDGSGVHALEILGVITKHIGAVSDLCDGTQASVIAVDSALYGDDIRVRRFVDNASTGRFNAVVVWGDGDIMHGRAIDFAPAEHRLSAAALAFKSCAGAALGLEVDPDVDAVERFRLSGGQRPIDGTPRPY
jgi:hypothetical protein